MKPGIRAQPAWGTRPGAYDDAAMPGSPRFLLACLLSVCAMTVAACGDEDPITAPPPAAPAAEAADFPKAAAGATLADLSEGIPEGPILAPSVSVLEKGENRVAFALFDRARKQIAGATLAIYTARPDGTGLRGPYVASNESLEVKPQFRSQTTSQDPDAATAIYVADVPFKRTGDVVVVALAKIDGRLTATEPAAMRVGTKGPTPPGVGDKAISITTPTVASVAGDVESIDTRVPPAPQLHEEDFAKVLGKKPAVLLFATPQLCQSKVCGPVVDVMAQVEATAPKDVAFIHMEIYNDNDISKSTRPQVRAYNLQTEPWAFVVDRSGKITARFEGAFSPQELERAVAKVAKRAGA
jgi:hypothetical protein